MPKSTLFSLAKSIASLSPEYRGAVLAIAKELGNGGNGPRKRRMRKVKEAAPVAPVKRRGRKPKQQPEASTEE